jgi:hypothetical protein
MDRRMLADDPFDMNNYDGMAERHWGLLHAEGCHKPAFLPFLHGVLQEADAGVQPTP